MAGLKPTFSLTIGGLSSETDNPVAGPQTFIVQREMDIPADSLQIHLAQWTDLNLGDPVSLSLGHDGQNEAVFSGSLVKVRPAIIGMDLFALGSMNELLKLRLAATFEGQTAGGIARDLIGQAGLESGTIDDGPTLPRFAVDKRLSAFAHLKGLADRLGFELYANRDGAVMFHALGDAANLDAIGGGLPGAVGGLLGGGEQYGFGQHLLAGAAERRPVSWGSVDVGGESPMSGQGERAAHWLTINEADYRGTAGSGDPKLLVLDAAARTKDLADRFAAGRLALAQRTAYAISLTVLGRPQVDLGDSLSVADVPYDLLNNSGYVRAIRHHFGPKPGFVTEFRLSVSVAE